MVGVMDEEMRRHFLGTHFFNPPRYMHLLELIAGEDTDPDVIRTMAEFGENVLGKGIVYAKDTPNFVANRILTFATQYIMYKMKELGLSVEEVDALTGPNVGHAKSATLRTMDLVGLDTYVHVVGNVFHNAPDDERHDMMVPPDFVMKMLEKGYLGQKSGTGFFKRTDERDEKGKPIIWGLDLDTLEYRPPVKPRFDCIGAARKASSLEEKVRIMHTGDDPGSKFVWDVFANMAIYAANRIPDVADDIVNIDNAAKWGFGWDIGIFETWDALGVKYACDRMKADGLKLPPIAEALLEKGYDSFYMTDEKGRDHYFDLNTKQYQPIRHNENVINLALRKAGGNIVKQNDGCNLIDIGDGIICAEFRTKMNTIDKDNMDMLYEAVRMLNEGEFEGMVFGNQGEHFSAGANIMMILGDVLQGAWDKVDGASNYLQQLGMAMRYCKRPIVSAPHHYTMGGGIELSQHCARVVINGETYGGLVEAGIGVIPAGGGTKEMLRRALAYVPASVPEGDPFPYIRRAFETIAMAKVSTSGSELIDLGYFTENDVVVPNFDHQIKRAKDVVLGIIKAGYTPPKPPTLVATGEPMRATFRAAVYQMTLAGWASEHDALVADQLARVLTGGDRAPGTKMTEQDVLDLEREAWVTLCGTEKTQARMKYMLEFGKPLRN
jgi:3-hydroxyacyl-CoA dehydrogenase